MTICHYINKWYWWQKNSRRQIISSALSRFTLFAIAILVVNLSVRFILFEIHCLFGIFLSILSLYSVQRHSDLFVCGCSLYYGHFSTAQPSRLGWHTLSSHFQNWCLHAFQTNWNNVNSRQKWCSQCFGSGSVIRIRKDPGISSTADPDPDPVNIPDPGSGSLTIKKRIFQLNFSTNFFLH